MDEVSLDNGEKMILKAQGTMQNRSMWQPGHLFLTNRRLIFIQVGKTILECSLNKIIGISIMQRNWLLGIKVKQLCIELNCGGGREHAYIAVTKPGEWVNMIKESMTLMLMERWGYNGAKPESPSNT